MEFNTISVYDKNSKYMKENDDSVASHQLVIASYTIHKADELDKRAT